MTNDLNAGMSETGTLAARLADDPEGMIPSGTVFGWEDYSAAMYAVENVLVRLFAETQAADAAAESALSIADGALDPAARRLRDMRSDIEALQNHAALLVSQTLPITGGQYTHLVAETFRTSSVRDTISDYETQLLVLQSGVPSGCPSRPALEVDTVSQTLRQRREGESIVFDGLPGATGAGGIVSVDKLFGTPLTDGMPNAEGLWNVNVGGSSPLAPEFSGNNHQTAWLPPNYTSGGAARLRVSLVNASPFTEVRLRGSLLPGNAETRLLETVAAVDSRPDTSDPASQPTRNITQTGTFTGLYPWQDVTPGEPGPVLVEAPGRVAGSTDRAVVLAGLLAQPFSGLRAEGHAILRYRAALPSPGKSPVSVLTSFVQVYYYESSAPQLGLDSPLDVETFRDALPSQAGSYAGWSQSTHLLSVPKGTQMALLVIGSDPFLFQGNAGEESLCAVCYSDVWVCDEAVTRLWDKIIPRPSASQLTGPGSIGAYVSEDAVDSLSVSVGNSTGALVISDVWITLGQPCPRLESGSTWAVNTGVRLSHDSPDPPPYALSLPTETLSGRASRDPLLLHQARYAGQGASEHDISSARLNGRSADRPPLMKSPSLRSESGLPSSREVLNGRRSLPPARTSSILGSYWKDSGTADAPPAPGLALIDGGFAARWKTLYSVLASLGRSRGAPTARAIRVLAPQMPAPAMLGGSLYVYSLGLSSLSLLRREYAPSGLYVSNPLRGANSASSAVPAEIHEVSLVVDPPLPTLGGRLRFWVIPDTAAGTIDSASAQLARAVPLDSASPRATFHSAIESLPGLMPAVSDTAESLGILPPAFYVTPSVYTQVVDSLDPDAAVQGLHLDFVPYINREAIFHIASAIAAGNSANPNVYDPNAIRPIIDYLSTFDGGFVPSVIDSAVNPIAHVEPQSVNTVILPYLDQNQKPVKMELPYTVTYSTVKQPKGLPAQISIETPQTIMNGDGTISVNFFAPIQEGDYSFDATAVFPGPPSNTYVVHVNFTVKKPYASSDILKAVTGYRPVSVTLHLPSGRTVLPDSLGPPRPGEIIYQNEEVLQTAQNIQLINNAASTAEYAFTSAKGTGSNATQVLTTQQRSFVTAHSPIAAGAQGTAIDLYWHRSDEFDETKGGLLTQYDIKIPHSDYLIDAHTGQITVNAQPPYNWDVTSAGYDQVIANYFWRVGDIVPREWFPPPSIYDVQKFTGSPLDFIGTPIDTRPKTVAPTLTGYTNPDSGELTQNSVLRNNGQGWTTYNSIEWKSGNQFGDTFLELSDVEGIYQDILYPGPGLYHFRVTSSAFGGSDSGGNCRVRLRLFQEPYSDSAVVEESGWIPIHFDHTMREWPTDQTFFQSTALEAALVQLTTVIDPAAAKPYHIRYEFQEQSNHYANGNDLFALYLHAGVKTPQLGCIPGYALSSDKTICNLVPIDVATSTTITVSGGRGAGGVSTSPTDVASLLKGPISQSYPVTRNVTNYGSNMPAVLRAADMDPFSPNYYPIIEYRIDPGGIVRFGTDLSSLSVFSGTRIEIQFEYLDINPRFAAEVLPQGETIFTLPENMPGLTSPEVETLALNSLLFLINARY